MLKSLTISMLLIVSLLTTVISVSAASLSLTPAMPSAPLGGTIQFSVTGDNSIDSLSWSAGGKVGGSSVAGTISATGLYTAPSTMPGQNPVQITVAGAANTQTSATTYVYLLSNGPVITSISPNPLPIGSVTVTITGSGFQP